MTTYALTDHTYACRTRYRHVVLLDLKRDKYFALDESQSRFLATLIPTLGDAEQHETPASKDLLEFAQALVDEGFLRRESHVSERVPKAPLSTPERALADQYSGHEVPIRLSHIICFTRAFVSAKFALRFRRIEAVVRSVEHRVLKLPERSDSEVSETRAIETATVFERLRPWFYVAKDACLLDSLVLMEFFLQYREPAYWVFGVTSGPFRAHAWAQKGDLVLTDRIESVRRYTPIMVIGTKRRH